MRREEERQLNSILTRVYTGYHANDEAEFAECFEKALSDPDPLAMRKRARQSATRFTEEEFAKKWVSETSRLVALRR